MNATICEQSVVGTLVSALEDALESVNLVALELAIKTFEQEETAEWGDGPSVSITELAERSLRATKEMSRLVQGLKRSSEPAGFLLTGEQS